MSADERQLVVEGPVAAVDQHDMASENTRSMAWRSVWHTPEYSSLTMASPGLSDLGSGTSICLTTSARRM